MVKDKSTEEIARKNVLFESKEPEGKSIKGYDFDNGLDYDKLLDNYETIGFQATHFAQALKIINKMISEKCSIYLGYTSNIRIKRYF